MEIKFITPELHAELAAIADNYPALVFNNYGYVYIKPAIREQHAEQIRRISEILKEHVVGFVEFFNFRRDDGNLVLRFDYNWGAANNSMYFVGVGYLHLDHLLNGFPEDHPPLP